MAQIQLQAAAAGGSVEITNDVNEAFNGVEIVYAKSWGSRKFYGEASKDVEFRSNLRAEWIVDEDEAHEADG